MQSSLQHRDAYFQRAPCSIGDLFSLLWKSWYNILHALSFLEIASCWYNMFTVIPNTITEWSMFEGHTWKLSNFRIRKQCNIRIVKLEKTTKHHMWYAKKQFLKQRLNSLKVRLDAKISLNKTASRNWNLVEDFVDTAYIWCHDLSENRVLFLLSNKFDKTRLYIHLPFPLMFPINIKYIWWKYKANNVYY